MKKIILAVLVLVLFSAVSARALETTLIDTRSALLKNAQEMKDFFATTRDPVLMNNMWDSSLSAVTQLDAYFFMLGIFNTIKKEDLSDQAFNFLLKWLNQVKESARVEVRNLDAVKKTADARSKVIAVKTKASFNELIARVDKEIQTVTQYQASLKK